MSQQFNLPKNYNGCFGGGGYADDSQGICHCPNYADRKYDLN